MFCVSGLVLNLEIELQSTRVAVLWQVYCILRAFPAYLYITLHYITLHYSFLWPSTALKSNDNGLWYFLDFYCYHTILCSRLCRPSLSPLTRTLPQHSRTMYGHTCSKSMDQPGKVANPARGQLNRENKYFPVRVRAWEFGLARRIWQSRPASACSSPYSRWVWCLLTGFLPSSAAASIHLF